MIVKTNWVNGEYFTYRDYNRVVDNVFEVCEMLSMERPDISYKTVSDIARQIHFNAISEWLETVDERFPELELYIPRKFGSNASESAFWNAVELSMFEQDFEIIAGAMSTSDLRITEDDDTRVTEDGDRRITE